MNIHSHLIVNKKPKVFFGWWTVLALGIVSLLGAGFAFQSFSIFFKPLSEELGFSRAVTSTGITVQTVVTSACALMGGWASDKYGPRRVILIGVITLALGCILMSWINSLWSYLLVTGLLIGGGSALGVTIMTDRAIVNWFVRKAGIAINLKFAIMSLSGLLVLPFVAWLVKNYDWRITYLISGIIIAVVCIPLVWFFVKPHRPEYYGLLPDGAISPSSLITDKSHSTTTGFDSKELTLKQALKTTTFWLFILLGYTTGMIMPMMGAHSVPFLTDRKIDPVQAASIVGLMSTVSIPARLLTGYYVDRLKTEYLRFIMASGTFIQAIGVLCFVLNPSLFTIYVWFILYGVGGGISQSVNLPLLARYFGRKAFGSITGLFQPLQLPVGLVAPVFIGWIFDSTGSYTTIIYLMVVLLPVAGFISCLIKPPKLGVSID